MKLSEPGVKPWCPRQVLEGVPDNAADKGSATIADVQEGLRRLKAAVAMQDPGKVAACLRAALAHAGCNAWLSVPLASSACPRWFSCWSPIHNHALSLQHRSDHRRLISEALLC